MNKKKLLFVIHRLAAGGAEKSLVSLLGSLPLDRFEVDLMAIDPTGIFRDQLPGSINVVDAPRELVCLFSQFSSQRFRQLASLKLSVIKIKGIIGDHLRGRVSKSQMCHIQYYNEVWRKYIPDNNKKYDVAISYIDGLNYYVIDHVQAKKKILWCHNDYNKLDFIPAYDRMYYEKADRICTISELCRKSLIENFPGLENKIAVVENISSARMINFQAGLLEELKSAEDGFINDKRCRLVSIGRLTEQKGFDYAVKAAQILKDKGFSFCWYVLGDGPLRQTLEGQARRNCVSDCVRFVGVRANPYPYVKQADIFVMPSRYEGKSIALDEAKILNKPIVVTNYPSVTDAIENGKNGLVVEMIPDAIAAGILKLCDDVQFRNNLVCNLKKEDCSNEKQVVEKFLDLIG